MIDVKTYAFKGVQPKEDYHPIIDLHAREGWRLVQIFAPPISGYGIAQYFELIFEREINLPPMDHLTS